MALLMFFDINTLSERERAHELQRPTSIHAKITRIAVDLVLLLQQENHDSVRLTPTIVADG
jgi:hypothetical protein